VVQIVSLSLLETYKIQNHMRKELITIVILLGLVLPGFSQFTKGKFLAGGTFTASSNSYKYNDGSSSSKSSSTSLNPQIGYFFIDNFAAGAGLTLSATKATFNDNSKATFNSISFAPFARYYFGNFYGQASFLLGSEKIKSDGVSASTSKVKSTGWTLAAGYAYLLNDHVAIEPQLGYKAEYLGTVDRTNGSLFLNIGLQVYIGK